MSLQRMVVFGIMLLSIASFSHAELPTLIAAGEEGQSPAWLSASEALPDGVAQLELIDEAARKILESRIAFAGKAKAEQGLGSEHECLVWTFPSHPSSDPSLTLESHYQNSWQIYGGTIVDVDYGFVYGYPAMLVELTIERTFKLDRERSARRPSSLYFVFRHAEIATEEGMLCTMSRRYPDLPAIGRRGVIFSRGPSGADGPSLLQGSDDDIFFERADGTLSAPAFVGEETMYAKDFEELLLEFDKGVVQ